MGEADRDDESDPATQSRRIDDSDFTLDCTGLPHTLQTPLDGCRRQTDGIAQILRRASGVILNKGKEFEVEFIKIHGDCRISQILGSR